MCEKEAAGGGEEGGSKWRECLRGGAPILRRAVRPILGHYGYF